jgi:hypothetical protein
MNTPGLIPYQTANMIVDNVDQARQDLLDGFKLLQSAKERLAAVLGDGHSTYYNSLWSGSISDSHLMARAAECDQFIATNAWRYLLQQIGMTAYMTERRQKALQDQLAKGTFPALTVANVMSTFQGLTDQLGTFLLEAVKEVFDWLRPPLQTWRSSYKTNHTYHVGMKVILTSAVESHWRGELHLNYYREANFRSLGNVMSLLDGQGVQHYPDDLVTQLRVGFKTSGRGKWLETPYLRCKPFGNGNLHIFFRRADLVVKLNQLGSEGGLPEKE